MRNGALARSPAVCACASGAAAMIFAIVPLAQAIGAARSSTRPWPRALTGGLLTSTLPTLFVEPVACTLLDILVLRLRHGRTPSHAPRERRGYREGGAAQHFGIAIYAAVTCRYPIPGGGRHPL